MEVKDKTNEQKKQLESTINGNIKENEYNKEMIKSSSVVIYITENYTLQSDLKFEVREI